jgi:putative FmdB family regulatory protein
MPVYEYECLKCGTRFEEIRKFSDPPVKKHTGCGGRVKRLLSAPAFHFKGTGWYVTDYANKNKKDGGSSQSQDAEKKADAKSDAAKSGSSGKTDSDGKADKSAKTDSGAKSDGGSKSDSAGKSDGGAKSSKSSEKASKS